MKKSVKTIVVPAVVCAMMLSSVACNKGDGGSTGGGSSAAKGETIDTGVFSAVCPDGYMNIPQTDVFGEKDEEGNYPLATDRLMFSKGAKSEWDAFSKPSVNISLLSEDSTVESAISSFGWFYDVEETSFTVNGAEVPGCTYVSVWDEEKGEEYVYEVAFIEKDERIFQVSVVTVSPEMPDGTGIDMNDSDVQAICESIALD